MVDFCVNFRVLALSREVWQIENRFKRQSSRVLLVEHLIFHQNGLKLEKCFNFTVLKKYDFGRFFEIDFQAISNIRKL